MAEGRTPWQLECEKVDQRCGYLLTSAQWSDCTFVVGSEINQEVIQAHKFVLTMASPVFEVMFYGGLAERNPIVPVPDLQPMTFRALLQYIYTSNINIGSFDMACDLWYGAHKYMLPHLVAECSRYIWTELCPGNACRTYEFAWLFDEITLMDVCIQIISTNTKEVLNDSSFEDVSLNTVITVCSLDHLNVDSELDLFHAVARYAEAEQRRQGQITPPEFPPSKKLSGLSLEPPTSAENVLQSVEISSETSQAAELHPKTTTEVVTFDKEDLTEVPEWARRIRAAIEKIRFLSLSALEFAEGPASSGLLTMDEWFAVLMNIVSRDGPVHMPTGYSECRERRRLRSYWVDEGPIAKPCRKPSTKYRGVTTTKLSTSEIVRGLSSRKRETVEQAARAARLMTCAAVDGTSENLTQLVAAGGIPPLVHALCHPSTCVQYDAAWAITNIASDREHTEALIDSGAILLLLALLDGGAGAVAEQAAWALGNIAADGVFAKDAVINAGVVPALLVHMQPSTPPAPLGTYVRTYRIICQKPTSSFWLRSTFELVSPAVPYIEKLLLLTDEQVLAEACWALYHLAGGAYFSPQLFTVTLAARVTALLRPDDAPPRVQTAALAAVGSMLLRTELRDRCLRAGGLDHIIDLLKRGNPSHVENASLAAGYILRSKPLHIQQALDKGILEALVPALTAGDDTCKYNAALAITRLCYCGSYLQLRVLAASPALHPYCFLLGAVGGTCEHVLQGLTHLLRVQKVERNTKVPLLLKLREIGVPQLLVTLLKYGNKGERMLANRLLQSYFCDDQ